MASCALRSCKSSRKVDTKKAAGITFHSFPRNPRLLSAWLKFVHRGSWQPTKYSVLCSKHFSEDSFDRSSLCYVRLKRNAVPTIHTEEPKQEPVQITMPEEAATVTYSINIVLPPNTSPREHSMGFYESPTSVVLETSHTPTSHSLATLLTLTNTLDSSLLVSGDRKNKAVPVRKKPYRQEKHIASMKTILRELRRKEEYVDISQKEAKNQSLPKQYSEAVKEFALTLHYYSPAAYDYLGRVFKTCLPHTTILSRWSWRKTRRPLINHFKHYV